MASGSSGPPSTPDNSLRRRQNKSEEWEDQIDVVVEQASAQAKQGANLNNASSLNSKKFKARSGRASPAVKSPVRKNPIAARPSRPSSSTGLRESTSLRPSNNSNTFADQLQRSFSMLKSISTLAVNMIHTVLGPFYPYIFLTTLVLLSLSLGTYVLLNVLPPLLFRIPGAILRLIVPKSSPFFSSNDDTTIGKNVALLPLRSLATPVCTLTGQLCTLSLLASSRNGTTTSAKPFWAWRPLKKTEVDVGEVARSLTKEAKGAKDIFESIAMLSEGGMMDRLEYVRIWELGTAIQIGSNLEEKEMVSEQLFELGNVAKDLSDELVDTNAMAVDAFTWLQWEFASLVKVLSLPSKSRPPPAALSRRLNGLLNRLSATLNTLHKHASSAHTLASRGSSQGRTLRNHLDIIGSDLQREQEKEPGWKIAVEKSKHFILGGELSPTQRLHRDLDLTGNTIHSLKDLVRDLEGTRSSIKGFRDQIGYFDASMMGFHLGSSGFGGVIGPEEELRVLAEVVEEFGNAVGRAKGVSRRNGAGEWKEIEGA